MRYVDLSYEGRQLAERNQLDNGKLPHGGHRGSNKHPPSHLNYEKGREFHQARMQELERLYEEEELARQGTTPSWSILVHKEPSYTDESPLITNNLLAANKTDQASTINLFNRTSLLPNKCARPLKNNGVTYYRPNKMHQYLTATELKDCAEDEVNVKYGRPTRTTLLRARQRCTSAPTNSYDIRREFLHRLDEIRTTCPISPNSEYLQLQKIRDGESLHSYLTGARYNRAHCLDSKSVENNGVYMPRHNPALGSFFTGPKGQELIQEYIESSRFDMPPSLSPQTPPRRPLTAPHQGRRVGTAPSRSDLRDGKAGSPRPHTRSAGRPKYKHLKLDIIGSRLPIGQLKDPNFKLPSIPRPQSSKSVEETFRVNQPPPTPMSMEPTKDMLGGASEKSDKAEVDVVDTEKTVEPAAVMPDVGVKDEDAKEEGVVEEKSEEEKRKDERKEREDKEDENMAEGEKVKVPCAVVNDVVVKEATHADNDEKEENTEKATEEQKEQDEVRVQPEERSEVTIQPEERSEVTIQPEERSEVTIQPEERSEVTIQPEERSEVTIQPEERSEVTIQPEERSEVTIQPEERSEVTIQPEDKNIDEDTKENDINDEVVAAEADEESTENKLDEQGKEEQPNEESYPTEGNVDVIEDNKVVDTHKEEEDAEPIQEEVEEEETGTKTDNDNEIPEEGDDTDKVNVNKDGVDTVNNAEVVDDEIKDTAEEQVEIVEEEYKDDYEAEEGEGGEQGKDDKEEKKCENVEEKPEEEGVKFFLTEQGGGNTEAQQVEGQGKEANEERDAS